MLAGTVHHGRSLIVWPDALADAPTRATLAEMAPFGARLLYLGERADLEDLLGLAPGDGPPVQALEIMTFPVEETVGSDRVEPVERWEREDVALVHELQRASGITPLPAKVLFDGDPVDRWDHWVTRDEGGGIVGVIHRQVLSRGLDGVWPPGSALTAALAVDPAHRHGKIGSELLMVAGTTATTCGVGFLDPRNRSKRLLVRNGWVGTGRVVQLVSWV